MLVAHCKVLEARDSIASIDAGFCSTFCWSTKAEHQQWWPSSYRIQHSPSFRIGGRSGHGCSVSIHALAEIAIGLCTRPNAAQRISPHLVCAAHRIPKGMDEPDLAVAGPSDRKPSEN